MENFEDCLPYNESVEIKKLGFNEPCFAYFLEKEFFISDELTNANEDNGDYLSLATQSSPTYRQVFKWFRDNHNLFHEIQVDRTLEPKFCYEIHWYAFDKENFPFGSEWKDVTDREEFFLYYKYEEAELECIRKMIEIVKNR